MIGKELTYGGQPDDTSPSLSELTKSTRIGPVTKCSWWLGGEDLKRKESNHKGFDEGGGRETLLLYWIMERESQLLI